EMVESSWFAEADFHTRLIEELAHAQKLAQPRTDLPLDLIAVAARALVRTAAAKQTSSADAAPSGPFDRLGAFRLFEGGGA
ncbi:MAG: hypothetical protein KDB53_14870, partial [Planctomycetes bacterium]|nr:hypothetical protein [Planctomycetota bacterium]